MRLKNTIQYSTLFPLLKWTILASLVGILAGSASALFLAGLEYVTAQRENHGWLLFLLPFGGALMSYIYLKVGKNAGKGNNLILEQIQDGEEPVPLRMAPLVLLGTWVTHLFGGSAGREGTAVQMAGSFAEFVGKLFRINHVDRKIILIAGISAGFSSVFGTPLTGTVFSIEVIALGLISYRALLPALIAGLVGDAVTTAWGIEHLHYQIGHVPALSILVIAKVALASILFGLTALFFSELTHWAKRSYSTLIANPIYRAFVGGIVIIVLVYVFGTRDYLGLGIPLLQDAFDSTVHPFAFLGKLIFTSLTLGAGFLGGEVTPLFVIGGTLGHSLGELFNLPVAFLAGVGLIAAFSGATNTPIACFILGLEMFGAEAAVYFFIASVISYVASGHSGIYTSQRIGTTKAKWHPIKSLIRISNRK